MGQGEGGLGSEGRLPWEIVETFPGTDTDELRRQDLVAQGALEPGERTRALVHSALLRYWAPSLKLIDEPAEDAARRRLRDSSAAVDLARATKDPDLLATALLGRLYAGWGPPDPEVRRSILTELHTVRHQLIDPELRLRAIEWVVLDRFDDGDLDGVRTAIDTYLNEAEGWESPLFARREVLWRSNLAMLEGRIDAAVQMNEDAIASTADLAGSPFSFQNVAITMAIAGYLRRGLSDLIGAIRSILASSPRVEVNWEVGLTFALSETGGLKEARSRFDRLAEDDFAAIPRDLNWLVATQLLGLVAVNLNDRERAVALRTMLGPFRALDATHGSGYASYGPVARTLGLLAGLAGDQRDAERCFDEVLARRGPGPWTTLARADRAQLMAIDSPRAALADAEQAERELRAFELSERATEVHELATRIRLAGTGEPIARHRDGYWTLSHPSGRCEVRHGVGIAYLVELLRRPGEPVDVVDLDTHTDPSLPRTSTVESTLDERAQRAYRRRLAELEAVDEPPRTAVEEAAFIRRELAAGSYARPSSAELERVRVRVTTAIRRSIERIAADAPRLAGHLGDTVVTGRRCSYEPPDGRGWRIER